MIKKFLTQQFFKKTAESVTKSYTQNIDPAGRRIVVAGIGGGVGGAVGGFFSGMPALGVGSVPGAAAGGIAGFSGGLLIQTGLEAVGLGQAIEDLINEVMDNFLDAIVDEDKQPCE